MDDCAALLRRNHGKRSDRACSEDQHRLAGLRRNALHQVQAIREWLDQRKGFRVKAAAVANLADGNDEIIAETAITPIV